MNSESSVPKESAIVEVSPQTSALVETEMSGETDEVKRETKALIEAIKKRAFAEMQAAGSITREPYLKAIRQARQAIEQNQLIDPEQIERSVQILQKQSEKSWLVIVSEIESLGVRLFDIAKLAWKQIEISFPNLRKS